MPAHRDSWILVISSDATQRASLRAPLDGAGYQVLEAPGAAEALRELRRSARPLTVLLDATMLPLLNAVMPDRRAARHHAYLLLCERNDTCHPRAQALLEQLALDVLAYAGDTNALLAAVEHAGRHLTDVPLYVR